MSRQVPSARPWEATETERQVMKRVGRREVVKFMGLGAAALTSGRLMTAHAGTRQPRGRPNVVFILTDDQRPDTIHALGNPHISTPNLDQLVRDGAVFTRALSPNPICTPSRAEILTGCSGFRNGVLGFGGAIDPRLVTWPQAMRAAGYDTCYVGKWHNNGRPSTHGYGEAYGLFTGGGGKWWKPQVDAHGRPVTGYRGWVFQTDAGKKFPERGIGLTPDISVKFADAALEAIRQRRERPFFLHVNFTAPHDPLLMPPGCKGKYDPSTIPLPKNFLPAHPFDHGNLHGRDERLLPWPRTARDVREDLAVYYAVISHMDEQIGRIVAALRAGGQWDNTLLVFTSDQGLAMGSHGLRGKQNMYDHTLGVPMIFHGPGIPRGRRFDAQMYLRDIYPTVCDLVGVPVPKSVGARSVVPVLRGKSESVHEHVFGHFGKFQRMLRTDRWKLIHYPQIGRWQLFDLRADPLELHDLSVDARRAAVLAELRGKLKAAQEHFRDPLLEQA